MPTVVAEISNLCDKLTKISKHKPDFINYDEDSVYMEWNSHDHRSHVSVSIYDAETEKPYDYLIIYPNPDGSDHTREGTADLEEMTKLMREYEKRER